jgi:hypothetical protein
MYGYLEGGCLLRMALLNEEFWVHHPLIWLPQSHMKFGIVEEICLSFVGVQGQVNTSHST